MRKRNRPPTPPGRILKELYLTPLGINNSEFARLLNVSRKAISAIVNEHKSITPDMALRLSRALSNTTPESWLNLQRNYDLWYTSQNNQAWQAIRPVSIPVAV